MNKEKICKSYCGNTCLSANCPITMYKRGFSIFEIKPTCKNCFYYKGCEDCCFKNSDMCEKVGDKNE